MVSGKNLLFAMLAVAAAAALPGTAFAEQPDKWVSYVESTGSQWVDTGIIGRWNTKAECKVEWMEMADSAFLATRDGAYQHPTKPNGKMYFCYCLNADGVMYTAQDVSESVNWYRQNVTWWPRFEKNRVYNYIAEYTATNGEGKATNIIKVDGQQTDNITRTGFDSGLNLYIFANNQTNKATACSKARCYGLKIWQGPKDGGDMVLVRDFQPCVKGNRAGLYDSVSDTIFYSGSGTDLICDENSEVPDEWIDYVESQGPLAEADGQLPAYIDTGIIGKSATTIEFKEMNLFSRIYTEDECVIGARSDADTRFFLWYHASGHALGLGYGGTYWRPVTTDPTKAGAWNDANLYPLNYGDTTHARVSFAAGSQTFTAINDETGAEKTWTSLSISGDVNIGANLYLFARNDNGKPDAFSSSRIYFLKIWQDGYLVRDFRPCLKNGVAGLYDDVTKRIFYSLGTPLIYETKKAAPKKKEIAFVEYIESDGWNTIDTGVPARSGLRATGDMMWMGPISDDNGTVMRSWEHDSFRYMESTAAAPVLWRQQHAYLSAVNPKSGDRFFMVHAISGYLDVGYRQSGTVAAQSGGENVK
ncbi:MAG: hypothetical protein IJG84_14095 [Kiritimatiellae bacterium]|nr:hypothetical protein [Kiritimatiellia bacterium]